MPVEQTDLCAARATPTTLESTRDGPLGHEGGVSSGNRYLLVVVDRGAKYLAAFNLSSKAAIGVSHKLFEPLMIFGLTLSIWCDPGGALIAKGLQQHL